MTSRFATSIKQNRIGWTASEQQAPIIDRSQLFVPRNYEPNYAYPLLIWITTQRKDPRFPEAMPILSPQNYIGLHASAPTGQGDGTIERGALIEWSQQLKQEILELAEWIRIHPQRIFLVGSGEAGTIALQLGLFQPDWFAGIAALNSRYPVGAKTLERFRDLPGLRVFLAGGLRDRVVPVSEVREGARLLHTTGVDVTLRTYDQGHLLTRRILLDLDRWVLNSICQPVG